MFAIGHFALGYLTGKTASRLLSIKLYMPLLLVASIIPDIDLILQFLDPTLFMHRGPLHSIITFSVLMIPFFARYRKQAIPYYVALLSHSLLGDLFTGGFEMLWPLSDRWFSILTVDVMGVISVSAELVLCSIALIVIVKAKDFKTLQKPHNQNLVLFIAFGATLGPLLDISQSFESSLPTPLVIPSIFWLAVFVYSMLIELRGKCRLGPVRLPPISLP
jgi:membrane-bound metal-dependent hydrolase YbcI (DUF457 family)